MIRPVAAPVPLSGAYKAFCRILKEEGFQGEVSGAYAERTVLSTDNSIYQRLPQAIVYPRHAADVQCIARVAAEPEHRRIVLTPRGGGTGTNGQSLTDGVVVDMSRHMNRILDIDVAARRVRVEAGVVKDQLNAALRPHGLFFAPELSTSNRATIGGMVSTDASGQGSCTYGKTRDHVVSLSCVYLGGERHESAAVTEAEARRLAKLDSPVGRGYRTALDIYARKHDVIESRFPKLNRCLTGYDLAHIREPNGRFNLNSLLCGSEGSLAFLIEATLNVLPIPKHSTLVNIRYPGFMDALRDAQALMAHRPLSIETVDSRVLSLAKRDIVWQNVSPYFPDDREAQTLGINLVEFAGDDENELAERVGDFIRHLRQQSGASRLGWTLAEGAAAVEKVYAMRKRAVGLLGNVEGEARPQPFVEDTAVPPEQLAEYIAEFRALLDGHGLEYGMFGHVDAGVLHVRPLLDMKDERQAGLVRPITQEVARLTQKYGGVLWGEHGKGLRSEFVPAFFGELYPSLQAVKESFDPYNQLNPGKIATPLRSDADLLRVEEVSLRAHADRQIDERVWQSFGAAMHCNGNGACYNFDPDDAMCPSWKATRQRVHSPKGRATLLREWLRLQDANGVDVLAAEREAPSFLRSLPSRWRNSQSRQASDDFAHEVYDAMAGCLACKSCAGQCPVKVNVPEFRSRFLAVYHTRYLRPIKDYLIGSLEFTVPHLARLPGVYNAIMSTPIVQRWLANTAGMVDSPFLSRFAWNGFLRKWDVRIASENSLQQMPPEERAASVVIVQDAFTRYFETPVAASFIELASRLGFKVYLAPFRPNGKPLHVQGFIRAFERAAKGNAAMLQTLAQAGIPLVGLDPAMTLVYRQEYRKVATLLDPPEVLLPQEWLMRVMPVASDDRPAPSVSYRLLAHCTEKTNVPSSVPEWQSVFKRAGLGLESEATGCCGMSGTYGHETRNVETSRVIFEQSWGKVVDSNSAIELLATGYSCRSQVGRLRGRRLRHPLEVLVERLRARS